jgi:hypothetical protein
MVPLTGTQQGERTHISPWGREFPLSLSRGKYGGLVHLCYFRRKPSPSPFIRIDKDSLYTLNTSRVYLSRKKAALELGGLTDPLPRG